MPNKSTGIVDQMSLIHSTGTAPTIGPSSVLVVGVVVRHLISEAFDFSTSSLVRTPTPQPFTGHSPNSSRMIVSIRLSASQPSSRSGWDGVSAPGFKLHSFVLGSTCVAKKQPRQAQTTFTLCIHVRTTRYRTLCCKQRALAHARRTHARTNERIVSLRKTEQEKEQQQKTTPQKLQSIVCRSFGPPSATQQ